MAETIQQQLREWLDESSTAVRYDEYQQSWRDHLADATAQASALLGIADRTRPMHIGVLLGNTPDMLTALAAAGLGGYVLCGINNTRRGAALQRDILHADCQILLTDAHHRGLIDGLDLPGVRVLDVGGDEWAALVAGAACGGFSGWLIAKLKIPPFIATLGMMMLLKGLSLVISGTKPIYFENEALPAISLDSLIGELIPSLPIPNGVLIMFLLAIAATFILNKTILGTYTFALGSNEEAVRLSGVNTDRWKIIVYSFAGGICGIAGLLMASRLNSAQPALGQGYELDAIAAVVIGGTSLSGGVGRITGTVIGTIILGVMTSGFTFLRVDAYYQEIVKGMIIVAAVVVDQYRQGKRKKV